jgi:hypothetical protein
VVRDEGVDRLLHRLARQRGHPVRGPGRSATGKAKLARLHARAPASIIYYEHTESTTSTPTRTARRCSGAPDRSGPSRDWIKVKNPDSTAMRRARAGRW